MTHEEIAKYVETEFKVNVIEKEEYYLLPTICHNLEGDHASHKLYLYKNEDTGNPIFYCYTECNEAFNIYGLIQKVASLQGQEITFREAYKHVHGKKYTSKVKETVEGDLDEPRVVKFENPMEVRLPAYPEGVLQIFQKNNHTHPWALEGIDYNALDKFEIAYSASYEGVVIPHRDWRGDLVGVRLRTYNEQKVQGGKYMPMLINNIYYRHPISLNLFGLFQNQGNIRRARKVILVESEKAVLQAETMLEEDNITLAVCGSSISSWQINLLTYYLEVDEVIIAFDKEYTDYDGAFKYFKKIEKQIKPLTNFATVKVLLDTEDDFSLKESPFDRTIREFDNLKGWTV